MVDTEANGQEGSQLGMAVWGPESEGALEPHCLGENLGQRIGVALWVVPDRMMWEARMA